MAPMICNLPLQRVCYEPMSGPTTRPNQRVQFEPDLCIPDNWDCICRSIDPSNPRRPPDHYPLWFVQSPERSIVLDFGRVWMHCEVSWHKVCLGRKQSENEWGFLRRGHHRHPRCSDNEDIGRARGRWLGPHRIRLQHRNINIRIFQIAKTK